MKILHVCAGWGETNGVAMAALQIVRFQEAGDDNTSRATWPNPLRILLADEVWTHCAWLPCLWWAGLFARRLVRMPHGSFDPVRLGYHGWKKRLVGVIERFFLRRAAKVVATCEAERDWILAYEPKAKVEVVDISDFYWGMTLDAEQRMWKKKRLGTPIREDDALRVLYLGRRHPLKGVDCLEEAVKAVNENGRAVTLRVVSNARGDEKEDAFDWCDVLCLPTLSENFGIVVAEALARGKPAITTDGAPAWAGDKRVTYIKGYRNAPHAARVEMLKAALLQFTSRT